MGIEGIVDKIYDFVSTPVPSPAACSEEEAQTGESVISLSRSEITAIMSRRSPDLNACDLHKVSKLKPFGRDKNQRI